MVTQQRNIDEPTGSSPSARARGRGLGVGTLLFAAACGIGTGLLAAPDTGRKTRKFLRKRLATLGGEVVDRWGDVSGRFGDVREMGARAGRQAKDRLAQLRDEAEDRWDTVEARMGDLEQRIGRTIRHEDEDRGGGALSMALGLVAGAGLAYFLVADAASPARSKVQEMAGDVSRQAKDRWEQFRRGGTRAPTDAGAMAADDT